MTETSGYEKSLFKIHDFPGFQVPYEPCEHDQRSILNTMKFQARAYKLLFQVLRECILVSIYKN